MDKGLIFAGFLFLGIVSLTFVSFHPLMHDDCQTLSDCATNIHSNYHSNASNDTANDQVTLIDYLPVLGIMIGIVIVVGFAWKGIE